MDFRFLEFLKEIINDTLYASIAKLAIAFYLGKKFIEFLITAFNIAYKKKEEQKEDIQYKKDVIEFLNKLDQKVNKLEESQIKVIKDLNTYKDKKHDIETKNIANIKIIERSNIVIEKSNDLMEKLNNKL
jgi:hypothetical protein